MLARWYRAESSRVRTTFHWFPNCACLCCGVILLGLLSSTCDLVLATLSQLVLVSYVRLFFLHALATVCVVSTSICTTFKMILSCFSEMTLRVQVFFTFWTKVLCQTSCLDLPLHTAQANHFRAVVSFSVFCLFSADDTCRMKQHMQNDFHLCIVFFALFRTASFRR